MICYCINYFPIIPYNVDGNFYNAIEYMYSYTILSVKLNNIFTILADITTGVRQGYTLSPTLFNIFLNDYRFRIVFWCQDRNFSLSVLCYADDIVILCDSEEKLQLMLNDVAEWCSKCCLKVNTNKSKVKHVRPKRLVRTEKDFILGN